MNKNILKPLIVILLLLTGTLGLHAARYDTSYVCSGTQVVLTAQNATGYTFRWLNETNTQVGTAASYTIPGTAAGVTNVPGAAPVRLIYKLIADSTGGASCSSDTFYKIVYALPAFKVAIDSGAVFYCVGSIPTNVVLASNVTANNAATPPTLTGMPAYVSLAYSWVNTPPSPAGTPGGTPTGQTYTVPGSALVTAGPGSYPYSNTVAYSLGTYSLGVGASATGTCTVTKSITVDITPQPSIQNVNVTTTFQ
ncbi:hypothetical protein [Taibaiella koreensis]|uniref:hypothetical protein n=1 Tax=Taibaiella koreensis TaxID=1268548 RepID=UPI000E599D0D|nr:hypothetical protein [Taibaiella koreensis]